MVTNKKNEKIIIKVIGYFLLTPGIVSVMSFLIQLFSLGNPLSFLNDGEQNIAWTGGAGEDHVTTATMPIYFALMAAVGAYLIKENIIKDINSSAKEDDFDK